MGLFVEVFSADSTKGRGLRAISHIEAGSCVLQDEPYVYILNEEQLPVRCNHCLRAISSAHNSEGDLKTCTSCKRVSYCNKACQVAGRKEHRYECKLLQGKSKDDVTLRLLTKMILKNKNSGVKKPDELPSELPSSYRDLCSVELPTKDRDCILTLFRRYEEGWRSKFHTHLSPFKSQEIVDVYTKLNVNSFSMYDEMTRTVIGEALFIRASMFNHSCEPNCTFVFDGIRLSVRAIRKIEAGEECCISYVSSLLPTRLRQAKLKSIYGFMCQCPRCLDTARDNLMMCMKCPNESCLEPILPKQDAFFQSCNTCHAEILSLDHSTVVERVEAFSEEVLEEVRKSQKVKMDTSSCENDNRLAIILKQCLREQSSVLHPTHHCMMRVRLKAMETFSNNGHWQDALDASQGVLEVLRLHLGSEDPYIAFFLLNVSTIHYNIGNTTKTFELLEQAIPLLERSYGDNHLVTQYAKDLQLKSS